MSRPPKQRRAGTPTALEGVPVYQLKITLAHVEPPVWRRVPMPGNIPLGLFHEFLQETMGWRNTHLHRFELAGRYLGPASPDSEIGDEDLLTLTQAVELAGTSFRYDYDFGDGWRHWIEIEDVFSSPLATPTPVCVEGGRACPPEDCGGPDGYRELLEALSGLDHPRHEELRKWLGRVSGRTATFDSERFDLEATNQRLRRVAKEHRRRREMT